MEFAEGLHWNMTYSIIWQFSFLLVIVLICSFYVFLSVYWQIVLLDLGDGGSDTSVQSGKWFSLWEDLALTPPITRRLNVKYHFHNHFVTHCHQQSLMMFRLPVMSTMEAVVDGSYTKVSPAGKAIDQMKVVTCSDESTFIWWKIT